LVSKTTSERGSTCVSQSVQFTKSITPAIGRGSRCLAGGKTVISNAFSNQFGVWVDDASLTLILTEYVFASSSAAAFKFAPEIVNNALLTLPSPLTSENVYVFAACVSASTALKVPILVPDATGATKLFCDNKISVGVLFSP
jgi:hypothetical protein